MEKFTKTFPLQKTLRFELRPMFGTLKKHQRERRTPL